MASSPRGSTVPAGEAGSRSGAARRSVRGREGEKSRAGRHLCREGRSSQSEVGSLVLGMTPMMVLLSEVPFRSRLRTSCMLRGESTLVRMVEPGSRTPSWVSSSGRRLGIWMALPAAMAARSAPLRCAPPTHRRHRAASARGSAPLRAPGRDSGGCSPPPPASCRAGPPRARCPRLSCAEGETPPPCGGSSPTQPDKLTSLGQ